MNPQKPNSVFKEEKENIIYILLFFFITSFLIKVVFGFISGSKVLLISGIFAIFGTFVAIVALLRIHDFSIHPFSKNKLFNYGKLEFTIVTGVSLIIIISTGAILFSAVHMIFFHTLYPSGLIAAWVSAILAGANWYAVRELKNKMPAVKEADLERIIFILNTDFVLSIIVILTVVISRTGFTAIDYILAIFEAIFIIFYGIYFLYNSLKGLMDASCDEETMDLIKDCIQKSNKDLKIQSLRVNPIGKNLEIISILNLSKTTKINEIKTLIAKIKLAITTELPGSHEILIGFATSKK